MQRGVENRRCRRVSDVAAMVMADYFDIDIDKGP